MFGTRARWLALAAGVVILSRLTLVSAQSRGPASKGPAPKGQQVQPRVPLTRLGYPYYLGNPRLRPLIVAGNNPRVRVLDAPRLDWSFAADPAVIAAAPRKQLTDHMSTTTTYQLWVPPTYLHRVPHPLILFVSAKAVPDEYVAFAALCRKYNVLFAVAEGGGDAAGAITRLRVTLDMFDDIRRRMAVDTDRVYVAGLSLGARTACEIAFAYPEFVGGVLAIGGAGSLRGEPYLRERVRERVSVALVTGEQDVSRLELAKYRFPVLRDSGVNVKLWAVPKVGTAVPPPATLEQAYVWLEAGRLARRALGVRSPMMRIPEGRVPTADEWSRELLVEAKARLKAPKVRDSGIELLDGLARRFKGTAATGEAEKLLAEQKDADAVLSKRQQELYHREAKALDDYLAGPLPARDVRGKAALVALAVSLWEQVEKYGPATAAGKEASKRLEALRQEKKAG